MGENGSAGQEGHQVIQDIDNSSQSLLLALQILCGISPLGGAAISKIVDGEFDSPIPHRLKPGKR